MDQLCAFVAGVRHGGVSSPRAWRALLTVMRFLARDRLGDERDGDEEAHLADRQGERLERLIVEVGRWLAPLPAQAVRDLVADAVAAEPGPALLAEAAGAGGNPLFVTELVGALLQDGTIRIAGGQAEVTHATLPPTLRLTILRRLSFLPDPTVQALRAASVLGPAFSLTDLATITGGSALELSAALDGAARAGVVADDGTRLRFRHDLIRDALYEDLPGSVRLGLHREAGQRRLLADTTVADLAACGGGSLEDAFLALTQASAQYRGALR